LPLRRAVDARVRPARFPAIQVRLRLVETLEAQSFERRLLRVADAGLDLPFGESCRLRLMRGLRIESFASPIPSTR
jgi:hypothetical protein